VGFAKQVPTEPSFEENPGYRLIQGLATFIATGALVAAFLMTQKAAPVYLGITKDYFERDVTTGIWVGIPTALCGAIISYLALADRTWDTVRVFATVLLVGNLLIPGYWILLAMMKAGIVSF
jgi:hypothetical protein